MSKVLVDTNILVYAANPGEGEKHLMATQAIEGLIKNQELCVGAQNLAEFCRVMGEKTKPAKNPDEIRTWVRTFRIGGEVLHYSGGTVLSALSISKTEGIHFYDALLVAVMREHGVDEIWTEDAKEFGKVRGLKCRNPLK